MYLLDRFFELHFITIVFWIESLNLIDSLNNSNYEQLVVSFQGMVSPNHVAMAGLIASESTQEKLQMLENKANGDTENGKNGVIKNRRWKKGKTQLILAYQYSVKDIFGPDWQSDSYCNCLSSHR